MKDLYVPIGRLRPCDITITLNFVKVTRTKSHTLGSLQCLAPVNHLLGGWAGGRQRVRQEREAAVHGKRREDESRQRPAGADWASGVTGRRRVCKSRKQRRSRKSENTVKKRS